MVTEYWLYRNAEVIAIYDDADRAYNELDSGREMSFETDDFYFLEEYEVPAM